MSDTALRTADSGYLTRRLVDVSQDLIIRDVDCCEGKAIPFMEIEDLVDGNEVIESLEERITGRTAAETMYDAEGNMIVKANHMITPKVYVLNVMVQIWQQDREYRLVRQ